MSAPCEACARRRPLFFDQATQAALCGPCVVITPPWFTDLRKRETNAQRRQREEKRSSFVGAMNKRKTA